MWLQELSNLGNNKKDQNNISLFPLKNAYGLPLYAFFIYLYINIKIMECLKNIIGITRSYCNCPNIDKYRESESGYYFDESAYSYDMKQWEEDRKSTRLNSSHVA